MKPSLRRALKQANDDYVTRACGPHLNHVNLSENAPDYLRNAFEEGALHGLAAALSIFSNADEEEHFAGIKEIEQILKDSLDPFRSSK